MPTEMLKHDLMGQGVVDYEDDALIRSLADRYRVSLQAIIFRLTNLGYIDRLTEASNGPSDQESIGPPRRGFALIHQSASTILLCAGGEKLHSFSTSIDLIASLVQVQRSSAPKTETAKHALPILAEQQPPLPHTGRSTLVIQWAALVSVEGSRYHLLVNGLLTW